MYTSNLWLMVETTYKIKTSCWPTVPNLLPMLQDDQVPRIVWAGP